MFLLVPAHPGFPGQIPQSRKTVVCVWKEYMEKLMNEENEWDHSISTTIKEGPADCIRFDEVAAALKKMKKHKSVRACSRNDTNHRGYWNSVDTGLM